MPTEPTAIEVTPYEKRLDGDWGRALSEGSLFFEDKGAVQDTLRRITKRLGDLGIPYAVVGGLALYKHGYRRFTQDVDLLVTPEGLRAIHECPEALGCVRPSPDRKPVRDSETGVRIDFFVTGTFPGDGRPKPVAFPDPAEAGVERDGIMYVSLPSLVELKLASGMTAGAHRLRDLTDVIELIKILKLPSEFANLLNPFVRDRFAEYWPELQGPEREP